MNNVTTNVAFFASGGGSTFEAFITEVEKGTLPLTPKLLVTNNSSCGAVEIAREHSVEVLHISSKTHPNEKEFAKTLLETLLKHNVTLLLLVGYMKKLPIEVISQFEGSLYNTHPSLLPKYGGKGMFGIHVHSAIIENKESETGVTIHLVSKEYDEGEIVAQKSLKVYPYDTPETLQEKVKAIERELYIHTIRSIVNSKSI